MKLKQSPDDFQVEELTEVRPAAHGRFAFYRLEKRGLGTPEAIQAICRRWGLEARRVAHGGLKDRHARTGQHVTVLHGPKRGLKQTNLHLQYLGQVAGPFAPEHIQANRFRIILRDLDEQAVARAGAALEEVRSDGVANYFDDQRFGSVGPSRQFVARALIAGDYEAALKLALVEPYEHDRAAQKKEKRILERHWGDWPQAKAELPRGHARSIVTYLADHPTDFRGAVARLRADLKSLYLSAYQSWVWNRMLAGWLEQQCRPEQLLPVAFRLGKLPLYGRLGEAQRDLIRRQMLPLPSARLKLEPNDPVRQLIATVLQEDELELKDIKLKHFREPFFARGARPVAYFPARLEHSVAEDEKHPSRQKLQLRFELSRGCYATMLVKRITV